VSPWASGEEFSSSPLQTNGPEENDNIESSWIELHEKASDLKLQQEALEAERYDVKARLAAAVEAEKRAQQARVQIEADRLQLLQLREDMDIARRTLVSILEMSTSREHFT
jgi:outer membrane protein TolC